MVLLWTIEVGICVCVCVCVYVYIIYIYIYIYINIECVHSILISLFHLILFLHLKQLIETFLCLTMLYWTMSVPQGPAELCHRTQERCILGFCLPRFDPLTRLTVKLLFCTVLWYNVLCMLHTHLCSGESYCLHAHSAHFR